MTAWTRATTVASTLSDRFGLEKWAQRNVILGIAARQDLYALAVAATPDDKDDLNRIADEAQEAAKSRSKANLGTALHKICERVDRGDDIDIPPTWRGDVDAYVNALIKAEIRINPDWIERVVVNPQMQVAGTLDRIVTKNGVNYIADIKTGEGAIEYGTGEIAIQLALYANATHMWNRPADDVKRDRWGRYVLDLDTHPDEFTPLPPVSTTTGLVFHLLPEQAVCDIYEVDLVAGLEAAQQALWVREWRKRKNLASTHTTFKEVPTTADDDW